MNRAKPLLPLLLLALTSCGESEEASCAQLSWSMVQWGSEEDDIGTAVALDATCAVSVAGETSGLLGEAADRGGGRDVFLARLGQDGRTEWLRQVGSPADDAARDVAVTPEGDTFVVGSAEGPLPGAHAHAGSDAFAMRHDAAGARQWLAQWGTYDEETCLGAVLSPRGQLLVAGASNARPQRGWDATLEVLSLTDGRRLSTIWYGTADNDRGEGLFLDASGAVYLSGSTMGGLDGAPAGSTDAYVARLTPELTQDWVRQSATRDIDAALRVAADGAGNVYVLAVSMSDLVAGGFENDGLQGTFLLKYDAEGHEQWRRRIGAREDFSRATGLALDAAGALYVAGLTYGSLGADNQGGRDAFLAKLDAEGEVLWVRQWGTERDDEARDLALTPTGDIIVVGSTEGDLAATNAGGQDVFLARFTPEGQQGAAR